MVACAVTLRPQCTSVLEHMQRQCAMNLETVSNNLTTLVLQISQHNRRVTGTQKVTDFSAVCMIDVAVAIFYFPSKKRKSIESDCPQQLVTFLRPHEHFNFAVNFCGIGRQWSTTESFDR